MNFEPNTFTFLPYIEIAPPLGAVLFINVLLINSITPLLTSPVCKYNAPASFKDQQFWKILLEIVKLVPGLAYNTPP